MVEGQYGTEAWENVLSEINPESQEMPEFKTFVKGIKLAILEKIFDLFFTTKQIGSEKGLGLSVSNGIIKTHGARIDVESKVGVGTRFAIRLPKS